MSKILKELVQAVFWGVVLVSSVWCGLSLVVATGNLVPDAVVGAGRAFALVAGGGAGLVLVVALAGLTLPHVSRVRQRLVDRNEHERTLRREAHLHEQKLLELRHRIERDQAAKVAGYRWVDPTKEGE